MHAARPAGAARRARVESRSQWAAVARNGLRVPEDDFRPARLSVAQFPVKPVTRADGVGSDGPLVQE